MNSPHYKVWCRLGISKVCVGIGVFSIKDIPKGTNIFEMDGEYDMVKVPQEDVESLPDNIKKLYHDFCPLNEGVYECPPNFNHLTPAWYLNHSVDCNCIMDENYDIIAGRNIKEGEELTCNYETYSEIPPGETV
jgi:SET domain